MKEVHLVFTVPDFKETNLVKEQKEKENNNIVITVIDKLTEDFKYSSPLQTIRMLKDLIRVNCGAYINLVMKTIAVILDSNYPDHISNAEVLYIFNTLNSKINYIDPKSVKKASFKYFAAFREKDHAVFAINSTNIIKRYVLEYDLEFYNL